MKLILIIWGFLKVKMTGFESSPQRWNSWGS